MTNEIDQVMREVETQIASLRKLFYPGTLLTFIVRAPGSERPAIVHTNEPDIGAVGRTLLTLGTPKGETKR